MASESNFVICKHLIDLAKKPTVIEGKGFTLETQGVEEVRIHPTFFQKDSCNACGLCCGNFETCFTENELQYLSSSERHKEFIEKDLPVEAQAELLSLLQLRTVVVNGKEKNFYISPPAKTSEVKVWTKATRAGCRWLLERPNGIKHCSIHPIRSMTCGIPHMLIQYNSRNKYTTISHRQYGRNWALGCEVPVGLNVEQSFDEDTFNTNIYWLQRLNEAANYLEIETWLPEVIQYLVSHKEVFRQGKYPLIGSGDYISFKYDKTKKLF